MNRRFSLLACFLFFSALTAVGRADSAAIIAKARAYLGSSETLDAVHSIHYIGKLDTIEEIEGADKSVSYDIDIIFQKPYQQRIVLTKEKLVETTALDDYEAWHRQQDKSDEARWRTLLFPKTKVKQLRASSWENLAFFNGIELVGGTLIDHGPAEVDGKPGYKLSFVHEPNIVYNRYFDPASGRLLLTETDQGVRIHEEGEIISGGIRFPKRIINVTTQSEKKERVVTINVDRVIVNETFPEDYFRVPLVPPK